MPIAEEKKRRFRLYPENSIVFAHAIMEGHNEVDLAYHKPTGVIYVVWHGGFHKLYYQHKCAFLEKTPKGDRE